MIISISTSTNGPCIEKHEVAQVGAAIYKEGEKISQFGSFVRPECIDFSRLSYVEKMGIRSLSEYRDRAPFLEPFYQVWDRFVSWCLRHSGYDSFKLFCKEAVWVGYQLDGDLLFLDKEARLNHKEFRYTDINNKVDINSLCVVMERIARGKGHHQRVDKDLISLCEFYNVPLKKYEDAATRAIAIGAVFHYHLAQQKEVYGL